MDILMIGVPIGKKSAKIVFQYNKIYQFRHQVYIT